MGKSPILIKADKECTIDSFSKIKESCGDFYKQNYNPKYSDVDSMEIRGRLDFINEEQTKAISKLMDQYKGSISAGDVEAICLDYKDSLCAPQGKLENALVEVAMYGQSTFVNQALFHKIKDNLIASYNFPSLIMAYISYSAMMKGSKASLNFNPFLLIETCNGHTNITINHDIKPQIIKIGPANVIQPKSNSEEYFSFGKHNSLSI
jgi:hypothetical protein